MPTIDPAEFVKRLSCTVRTKAGEPLHEVEDALQNYLDGLPFQAVDWMRAHRAAPTALYRDGYADEWEKVLARAREIVRERTPPGVGPTLVRIGHPGGRPRNPNPPDEEERRKAARKRAAASKAKRKAEGRKEVKYLVTSATLEAAQKLIAERGLAGGMTELFERLVAEAAAKSKDEAPRPRRERVEVG